MYVLVYGEEWEDISYFTDYNKACIKLIKQSISYVERQGEFYPFMNTYDDIDGVMIKQQTVFSMNFNKYKELLKIVRLDEIKAHPELAINTIETCL